MPAQRSTPIVLADAKMNQDSVDQIQQLSAGMKKLSRGASPDVLSRIKRVDQGAHDQIKSAIKTLPKVVTGQVASAIKELVNQRPDLVDIDEQSADDLSVYIDRVSYDPRSAKDAGEALDKMAKVLAKHPALRGPVGKVLKELEKRRFLGASTLAGLAGFLDYLHQTQAGIKEFQRGRGRGDDVSDVVLSVGDVSLRVQDLREYTAKVKGIGFPWIPGVVSVTVKGYMGQRGPLGHRGATGGQPGITSARAKIKVPLDIPVRKGTLRVSPYASRQVGEGKDWGVGVSASGTFGASPDTPQGWGVMPWMVIIR